MLGLGLGTAGGARGWVAGRAGFWGALATWVWGQAIPVVRVCVTVVGLVQSSFLCAWVSGYYNCNLCVRRYNWSQFYRA